MRRFGFVVNPIAGMGGRVGLKGTDGKVEAARERGAEMRAPDRAAAMLRELRDITTAVTLVTYDGRMGAREAATTGFEPEIVGAPAGEETTAADTRAAVTACLEADVELVLFVGGDGTAIDVAETLEEHDSDVPILGVPAGVKVYSGVFAVTPEAAAHIATSYDRLEQAEVNDIDEDEYRDGEVKTTLHALATVPVADRRQSSKQLSGGTVEGLAERYADGVESDVTYILGPGSTVGAIKDALGIEGSPLGVDVYRDGSLLVKDAAEAEILAHLGEENRIVVTPIGGQGFVFGRGNDQLSPAVIRQSEIDIVGSRRKLDDLGVLRVDTGDTELDEQVRGWHRVQVGSYETRLMELV